MSVPNKYIYNSTHHKKKVYWNQQRSGHVSDWTEEDRGTCARHGTCIYCQYIYWEFTESNEIIHWQSHKFNSTNTCFESVIVIMRRENCNKLIS